MAKKENSGLKAGFTKDETVQRKADARKIEEEQKAAIEHARKQAEEAQQADVSTADESSDEAGPTITMQGVSGKKITSTVKVVKVRKAADTQVDTDEADRKQTAPTAEEKQVDEATKPVAQAPTVESVKQVEKPVAKEEVTEPKKVDPVPSEPVKAEASEKLPEVKAEKIKDEAVAEKAPKSKVTVPEEPKAVADQSATKTDTKKESTAVETPKASTKENKEESTANIATPTLTTTLPSTTPTPRKIKSGSDVQAEQAVTAAPQKAAAQKTEPTDRRPRDQKRPQDGQRRPQGSDRPSGQQTDRKRTDDRSAARPDRNRQQPGPNAPNRGQGPTREAKPVGTLNRPITPGKVGNIFDKSTKSEKVDSGLAATAKAFAQRKERQNQAAEERTQRRGGQGGYGGQGGQGGFGGQGPRRGNQGQGGYRPGGDSFGDKDKDDDQKPQFRKKTVRKTSTDEFAPVAQTRTGFAQRDAKDKNKHNRNRDRGSKAFQDRGGLNDLRRQRGRQQHQAPKQPVAVLSHVSLPESLTVKELAEAMKKTAADVIKTLMGMGVLATMNQVVDYDTAALIAGEYGIDTDLLIEETEEDILFDDSDDNPDDLVSRPPVVAVMGHVDHGKTSLLDYIRSAHVTHGEAGGITQHIGAYQVRLNDRKITFLDTPGHEAFTTMRARGAQATDIAILVVAADDGVMPQTIEAINHAKAANTEIVVAINKIDKPAANIDRVIQELSTHGLITEDWGGSTVMVPVSAKTGEGIEQLLEMVLLTADILELKANPNRQAKGIVIEAKLDKNRGPLATMLVQRGTLSVGDTIVTGAIVGNIRAMVDANQNQIKKAGPSVPVEIMGLPEVPEAGDIFYVVSDERVARQLAEKRRDKLREDQMSPSSRMSLDNLFSKMAAGEVKELNLIVKADVQGSVEAVRQSLEKLNNDEVKVNIIHGAVGAINETDVRLAEVSNAIIIGFNVRPTAIVTEQAKASGVDLRLYSVIYAAIEDIEKAMKGMLAPEYKEVVLGHCEIRETFKVSSIGTIGGGYVTDGKIVRNASVRLLRDGIVIHEGQLASLRRFKDDVREVASGYECGISLERYNDLKEGDVIEAYEMQEVERK